MQSRNVYTLMLSVLMAGFLTSCASTHAPSKWLPDPADVRTSPFGSWIEIESSGGRIRGELIAVVGDTLFVADTLLHAVDTTDIRFARLVRYDVSGFGLNVFLATLTTASHGMFAAVTAPIWIIGGSIAAASRSREPLTDYPDTPLNHFVPYARYPHGIPATTDRNTIRMKPNDDERRR